MCSIRHAPRRRQLRMMGVFAGPVSAHLSFSCNNDIDSHYFVARLGRVDGTTCYRFLDLVGAMSPARRQLDPERSTALTSGEAANLSFSLTPAPVSLRKGEKLRLRVGSRSDLLKSDVSHGYVHFGLPAP